MKIFVIFPTATEAQFFTHPLVDVVIGGVGLSAATLSTMKLIAKHKPDWLILAGIAGVYPNASFSIGDVVLVSDEYEADLGFFTPSGFTHLTQLDLAMDVSTPDHWHCPHIEAVNGFSLARSNSVNTALAPFVKTNNIDIENMEGAAFFQACLSEEQKFLEIRSISNRVCIHDDGWDMVGSIKNLTQALHQLIEQLLASKITTTENEDHISIHIEK